MNTKTSRNAMGRKKKYTDEELKEHNRERARRYYVLHRDEMMRRNREWRKANTDRIREYGKGSVKGATSLSTTRSITARTDRD